MKTLVLCVDRDDDLGRKAGVSSPVIGRDENLKASVSLGLADPEEADMNTIFSGLQLYDDLVKRGMEVEIATVAGDPHVGHRSDQILSNQLENVLEVVKPDRAILVSDGAEDEVIYPIISSRIKIDSVRRVYVKQDRSIESTYHMISKTLQDEKMRRRVIVPISLFFTIIGSSYFIAKTVEFIQSDYEALGVITQIAVGLTLVVFGLYLIGWAYHWGDRIRMGVANTKKSLRQGGMTIPADFFAVIFFGFGILFGYDMASVYWEGLLPDERSIAITTLLFISGALWFVVFGVFVYETGKSVTATMQSKKIRWSYIVMMVSILATGFIVQGAVDAIMIFVDYEPPDLSLVFLEMITGILIAFFGSVLNALLRTEAVQKVEPRGA